VKKKIVTTRKGGVGKTTVVVHGAWFAAQRQRRRVLVIDLDGQGNATQTLAAYAVTGITASRLFDPTPLPPFAAAAAPETGNAIALIGADRKLDDYGKADAKTIIPAFVQHMRSLENAFDEVWIDTPPSASIAGIAALIAGDAVISPIDLEPYSVNGVATTVQEVRGVQQRFNKGLQFVGILPSRVDGRSEPQQDALRKLVKEYPSLVLPIAIKETEAIAAVPRAKVPVWQIGTSAGREHGRTMLALFEMIDQRVVK
jgi:chromosome partitioning protein